MKTLQMSVALWNSFFFFFFHFVAPSMDWELLFCLPGIIFLHFFIFFQPILAALWGKAALLCALSSSGPCTAPAVVLYSPLVRIEGSTHCCSTGGMQHRNSFSPMSCSRKTCPRALRVPL